MNVLYVTPTPSNYYTSGLGLFNKAKKRKAKKGKIKARNIVHQAHIEQNRKSGPHKNRKKEQNKRKCRGKVKTDNF